MTKLREALIATLRESADRERPLYARLDDPAADSSGWTVRDHVAHLAAWRREAVDLLKAVRRQEPPRAIPDVDAHNVVIYERHRDWSAQQVLEDAEASYTALLQVLDDYPDDLLRSRRPGSENQLWRWVPGNGHEHVAEHLAMLAAEAGDEAGAEAAQQWSQRLDESLREPAGA